MNENLSEILSKLRTIDDDLAPEDFDPAALVGDLRDKVDAIKWRIDTWEAAAAKTQDWIDLLEARKKSLNGKVERLESYVKIEMIKNEFESLPGHVLKLKLQNNAPKVVVDAEANAQNFIAYPEIVKQKVTYDWDKKTMLQAMKEGHQYPFAKLEVGKQIRFYPK